jgi:fumarylacetoacetate (FAA) hydrolase
VARSAGSACIAERRVIEKIDLGEIRTGFMRFGDTVRMQAHFEDGRSGPFGVIAQRVVAPA